MGTITATVLINNVATALKDTTNVRWLRAELLAWVNEAQRQISLLQPTANNKVVSVVTVPGSRQTIPGDGWLLLDIIRNMGPNPGNTPGNAIRIVSRELLDGYNPAWQSSAQSNVIQNFTYSLDDQTAFYVYPPSDGTAYIEINYAQLPAPLAAEANPINVPDLFDAAIENYMLYRACMKDAEYAPGATLAAKYQQDFVSLVKSKEMSEKEGSANWGLLGNQPETRGGTS